jgi:hypothetical protein
LIGYLIFNIRRHLGVQIFHPKRYKNTILFLLIIRKNISSCLYSVRERKREIKLLERVLVFIRGGDVYIYINVCNKGHYANYAERKVREKKIRCWLGE